MIEWIENRPVFSSIATTIVVSIIGGVVAWTWTTLREKFKVRSQLRSNSVSPVQLRMTGYFVFSDSPEWWTVSFLASELLELIEIK